MREFTAIAPSAWAPYLLNGDASSLNSQEFLACHAWLMRSPLGKGACEFPVSRKPAGLRQFEGLLTDCYEYTFLMRGDE